jgi:mono/diheme cytochrome c family protein
VTRALIVVGLSLLACAGLAACEPEARPGPDRITAAVRRADRALSRQQARGKALFDRHCAICHGAGGAGDGFNASRLQVIPPPMRYIVKRFVGRQLRRAVEGGSLAVGRSSLCPPWGATLKKHGVDAVLSYLPRLARPERGAVSTENAKRPR